MKYYFEKDQFIIQDYHRESPFSGFLPGLAGVDGIPMWCYYVNRGQGVASFGVDNKNNAIMEFAPANVKYKTVGYDGFRTFIKIAESVYEPFSCFQKHPSTKMNIAMNALSMECEGQGLRVTVKYFILPHESFGALVRRVSIENVSSCEVRAEVLDGMPAIIPYGIQNNVYREISNTLMAWMDVFNLENRIPFYKLRSSSQDSSEVRDINGGYFYLSFMEDGRTLPIIVDSTIIFGADTSFSHPLNFENKGIENLIMERQVTVNKVPCGFTAAQMRLKPGQRSEIVSYIGFTRNIEHINSCLHKIARLEYINTRESEAEKLVSDLTDKIQTKTSRPVFDMYAHQCYMDNVLRGGEPVIFKNRHKDLVYHVFSRRHGDLERDYNVFKVSAEPYSQGNGNFRDVNQNRRCDVLFNPRLEDFNIVMFMNLIQADGYNPLSVDGCYFTVGEEGYKTLCEKCAGLADFLGKPFTPGTLALFISENGLEQKWFDAVMFEAEQHISAEPKEGYWIDHFTYNMDLIESYLSVYPDRLNRLVFENRQYKYYDSHHLVRPRCDKYVLTDKGVRQYGAVDENEEKLAAINGRKSEKHWLRLGNEVYRTNLFEKLLVLGLNKAALLDPDGIGIEMEANRPGWNDAMNGLPGLMGSGVGETFETVRILRFVDKLCTQNSGRMIALPEEIYVFLNRLAVIYADKSTSGFECWDKVAGAREAYRESVKFGFGGPLVQCSMEEAGNCIAILLCKLEEAAGQALSISTVCPTYLYYNAVEFETIRDNDGKVKTDGHNRPFVSIKKFERHILPEYLEGPVRAMKVLDKNKAKVLYDAVKNSNLYDKKLKMYKTNASLAGETYEIGRCRAFTPGWLENEAVFLHMEYKYLLEMLKAGLYHEFYSDMKTALIPFLNPEIYGRSTLENSSFIASSANPDPTVHGRGFVARLSGSTAEFLNMWHIMMAGEKPFGIDEKGRLYLAFRPVLPVWLFDEQNTVSYMFLGTCKVTYINHGRVEPYNSSIKCITLLMDKTEIKIEGAVISTEYALKVRNGEIKSIVCEY